MWDGMMDNWFGSMAWLSAVLSWLLTVLLIILLVVGIVYFVRMLKGREQEDKALKELRNRYAKGEIDKQEFEEKKNILKR